MPCKIHARNVLSGMIPPRDACKIPVTILPEQGSEDALHNFFVSENCLKNPTAVDFMRRNRNHRIGNKRRKKSFNLSFGTAAKKYSALPWQVFQKIRWEIGTQAVFSLHFYLLVRHFTAILDKENTSRWKWQFAILNYFEIRNPDWNFSCDGQIFVTPTSSVVI